MLAAFALALLSTGEPAVPMSCKSFAVPVTPAEQAADALLVGKAYGHKTEPGTVTTVLKMADWRLIWAAPADDVTMHVFFLRGADYRGKWDAVGEPQARYLAFARKLNVPAPLARCFADRMQAEPSI